MQKRLATLAALSFFAAVSSRSFWRAGAPVAEPPISNPNNSATIYDIEAEAPNAAFIPDTDEAVEYASTFISEVANDIKPGPEPEGAAAPSAAKSAARAEELAKQNLALRRELAEARNIQVAEPARPPVRKAPAAALEEELVSVSVPARIYSSSYRGNPGRVSGIQEIAANASRSRFRRIMRMPRRPRPPRARSRSPRPPNPRQPPQICRRPIPKPRTTIRSA